MSARRILTLVTALSLAATLFPGDALGRKKGAAKAKDADDLEVVACLLPGQVRQLGRRASYVTARRPIRTTAIDCQIRGGEYTAYDRASYAASLNVWLPAAKEGDPEAQTYVGEIFEKGLAGTPDYAAAAEWYRKAAEQGHGRAQINLGNLYEKGLGVEQDAEIALQWYRRSAGIDAAVVLNWAEEESRLRGEMESLREELEEVRGELEAAQGQLKSAEEEVARLQRELDKARASGDEKSAELAKALAERQAEAEKIRATVDHYRERMARLRAVEDDEVEVAGPTLTVVQPEVLATRGPMLVPVEPGGGRLALTGRVTAPAGLASLTVAGEPATPDENGFFRAEVSYDGRREIRLEALDRRDRQATIDLVLAPGGASVPAPADTPVARGRTPKVKADPSRHALVLGVADYRELTPLRTAAADAREVARVLGERYGYNVRLILDPSHFEILQALGQLAEELGEGDSLIIYYAGHGKLEGDRGYWIGTDGGARDPDRWIPNEAISDLIDVIPARHVLVVSDSCYAGTLSRSGITRTDGLDGAQRAALEDQRTRTVLTSGGLQPVLDEGGDGHSIFARVFLRILELNSEPLSGQQLHQEVAARVRFRARALGVHQKPEYAPIQHAGHEAGDFLLSPL